MERPETVEEGDVTAADAKDQNKRTQDSIIGALVRSVPLSRTLERLAFSLEHYNG